MATLALVSYCHGIGSLMFINFSHLHNVSRPLNKTVTLQSASQSLDSQTLGGSTPPPPVLVPMRCCVHLFTTEYPVLHPAFSKDTKLLININYHNKFEFLFKDRILDSLHFIFGLKIPRITSIYIHITLKILGFQAFECHASQGLPCPV